MNEYDDSDDYSSANSFRARSNTWPLNRPDLNIPDGVCIDEPLPEIELEEDDLFTTNENWSTNLVDNDIMSWGPILNSQFQTQSQQQQHQQQQQQQAAGSITNNQHVVHPHNQPATIHHHSPTPSHPQQHNTQPSSSSSSSQQQQSSKQHLPPLNIAQGNQQRQISSQNRPQPHHIHQQQHPTQQHEPVLSGSTIIIAPPQTTTTADGSNLDPHNQQHLHQHHQQHAHQAAHYQQQQQQQIALSAQQRPPAHQTLNNAHLISDQDDLNDYHVRQLHHLRLDSGGISGTNDSQQQHNFAAAMSSMCIQEPTVGSVNHTYDISSDHDQTHHHQSQGHPHHQPHEFQHSHLQPLNPARYDLDQRHDFDVKQPLDDDLHLRQQTDQLQRHPHPEHSHHHQHHHHHQPQQTIHQMTSSSLDNCSTSSHMLSTSLSTSGIGLGGELEDLDYKPVDPSSILTSQDFENQPGQHQSPSSELQDVQQRSGDIVTNGVTGNDTKQSNSTSSSKTKLNTPRRNAWGNMSYADLISQAINSTNDKRLTLSQIYDWMVQHVPYFKDKGDSNSSAGWKNSVRHNLSLHNRFKRLQNEGTGKSSWWTINPEASIGKCARRRAASMEASKYEKKRGRAKKRAEAIRQGLISYPSLTDSSLNGSLSTLEPAQQHPLRQESQQQQQQPQPQQQQPTTQLQQQQLQAQQSQPQSQPSHQQAIQSLEDTNAAHQLSHVQQQEQVSTQLQLQLQQQPQHHSQLPNSLNCEHISDRSSNDDNRYIASSSQEPQQSQYYYQFELSTAL